MLRAACEGRRADHNFTLVADILIAQAGSLPPSRLSAAHVMEAEAQIRQRPALSTRYILASALRRHLRMLWEHHGAPRLDRQVSHYHAPRPRNVTVTDEERAAVLSASPPHLRLWLLFCADLAIRSGTAVRLAAEHYDHRRRTLTFTTKCGEKLTLPTTAEIESLLDDCEMRDPTSFVRQLWFKHRPWLRASSSRNQACALGRQFRILLAQIGITRKLTLHDLRRTTAVAMYRYTRNIRAVQALLGHRNMQSTIWYLDHDLEPIEVDTLETIKKPFIVHRSETKPA